MIDTQPVTTPAAPVVEQPEYKPIDPLTYHWQPGETVRNQVNLVSVFDKDGHHFIALDSDYYSFDKAFSVNVVRPVTFQELRDLTERAVRDFSKNNQMFKNRTPEQAKAIVKDIYAKLFTYWYKELSKLQLVNAESFKQAKEENEQS